ncbi:hypothetical protein [Bacillus sp. LL01]|uniref:hypothetical protein n=1 Tax=Bacillus sp. LL01 TaxID=1665556 RepID=UPI0018E3C775|nr:hypothetical protein [Bacillus sp. LL01]
MFDILILLGLVVLFFDLEDTTLIAGIIAFTGAIIGGVITYSGVLLTIERQRVQNLAEKYPERLMVSDKILDSIAISLHEIFLVRDQYKLLDTANKNKIRLNIINDHLKVANDLLIDSVKVSGEIYRLTREYVRLLKGLKFICSINSDFIEEKINQEQENLINIFKAVSKEKDLALGTSKNAYEIENRLKS